MEGITEARRAVVAGVIAGLLAASGCGPRPAEEAPLARVGKAVLTREELRQTVRSPGAAWHAVEEPGDYVNRWVDRELLYQEAELRGLQQNPQVRRELQRLEKNLMIDLVLEQEVDRGLRVSHDEVTAYYAAHPEMSLCAENEYLYEHIRVSDLRAAARVERLIRETRNFDPLQTADVAIDWVQPRASARFTPASALPAGVRETVDKLAPQGVSRRIPQGTGFEFVALVDFHAQGTQRPLAEVESEIRGLILAEKRRQRYHRLITELRNRADVELNLPADLVAGSAPEEETTHASSDTSQ